MVNLIDQNKHDARHCLLPRVSQRHFTFYGWTFSMQLKIIICPKQSFESVDFK